MSESPLRERRSIAMSATPLRERRSITMSELGDALSSQQECGEISLPGDSRTVGAGLPLAPIRPHRGGEGRIQSGMVEHERGGNPDTLSLSNPWLHAHALALDLDAPAVSDRLQPFQELGCVGRLALLDQGLQAGTELEERLRRRSTGGRLLRARCWPRSWRRRSGGGSRHRARCCRA